ncbi:hypothetical protein BASA81_012553 [Batrachochytrium salamandrivorans]|nr:hypothetical protein BASA81_012553 [Batrachochytrium salamandrivorans]
MTHHEEEEEEDAEELAFQERLRKLAMEGDDDGHKPNTKSMDLRMYGIDMSAKPAASAPRASIDDDLAREAQRAMDLVAKATSPLPAKSRPSAVSTKKVSLIATGVSDGGKLPPPGLPGPRQSIAPPPGLTLPTSKWQEYFDENMKAPYWHCKSTGETTWIDPHKPAPAPPVVCEKQAATPDRVADREPPALVSTGFWNVVLGKNPWDSLAWALLGVGAMAWNPVSVWALAVAAKMVYQRARGYSVDFAAPVLLADVLALSAYCLIDLLGSKFALPVLVGMLVLGVLPISLTSLLTLGVLLLALGLVGAKHASSTSFPSVRAFLRRVGLCESDAQKLFASFD